MVWSQSSGEWRVGLVSDISNGLLRVSYIHRATGDPKVKDLPIDTSHVQPLLPECAAVVARCRNVCNAQPG